MYILIPVIFLIFFIPIKVDIQVNAKLKDKKIELEQIPNMPNKIKVKLFSFIPVFKKELLKENKNKKNEKKKKIISFKMLIKILKVNKLSLSVGINTYDYILNSYLNAIINTTICMYVNMKQNKFDISKLYYQVYTASQPLVINLDATVSISLIAFLFNFLKDKFAEFINHSKMFCAQN